MMTYLTRKRRILDAQQLVLDDQALRGPLRRLRVVLSLAQPVDNFIFVHRNFASLRFGKSNILIEQFLELLHLHKLVFHRFWNCWRHAAHFFSQRRLIFISVFRLSIIYKLSFGKTAHYDLARWWCLYKGEVKK